MRHRTRGFTLIELMVVLGIFALLSVMAYGGLASVLDTRRAVERSLDRTAALQRAYLRLRDDFQQLRDRPARDGFGEEQPALRMADEGAVEFTRAGWRNPLGHPRPSLQRVAYRLDEEHDRLLRLSWTVLDRAPDSEPVETAMLDDVERLEWRFLDARQEWHATWPPLSTGPGAIVPLPQAVELTLETRDVGELRFLFRSGTQPLPAAAPAPGKPGSPAT